MVFKIGKNNFILLNERIKYNSIKREYITLSAWAREEFKNVYKSSFNDIDGVIEGVREISNPIIDEGLDRAFDILNKENVSLDKEEFRARYYKEYSCFDESFNAFMEGNYSFRNPNTLALFLDGIEKSVLRIHELVAIYISEQISHTISRPLTTEGIEEFEKLYEKVYECEDNIVELLKLNPYDKRIYFYIMKNIGDENREVEKLCDMLDVNLSLIKRELIDDEFNKLDLSTEEATLKSKSDFIKLSKFIGYENIGYYTSQIDGEIEEYNRLFCTVNGIEFPSREESITAKEEKRFIEECLSLIKEEKEEELNRCKEKILSSKPKTIIKDEYLEKLEERIKLSIYTNDKITLDECANEDKFKSEKDVIEALEIIKGLNIRTEELLKGKIEALEEKMIKIIEERDKDKVEEIMNSYIFLDIERVYEAINEIAEMEIRTEWIKDEACELLSVEGDKLVKEHRDLLSKARRYEERSRHNKLKEEGNVITKAFKKLFATKIEEYDKHKEEKEKEAWNFITNYGVRNLEDIE